jgi:hypothetical protein
MSVMQGRFVPTKEAMRLDTSIDIPLHAPCRPIVRLNKILSEPIKGLYSISFIARALLHKIHCKGFVERALLKKRLAIV